MLKGQTCSTLLYEPCLGSLYANSIQPGLPRYPPLSYNQATLQHVQPGMPPRNDTRPTTHCSDTPTPTTTVKPLPANLTHLQQSIIWQRNLTQDLFPTTGSAAVCNDLRSGCGCGLGLGFYLQLVHGVQLYRSSSSSAAAPLANALAAGAAAAPPAAGAGAAPPTPPSGNLQGTTRPHTCQQRSLSV